MARFGHGKLLQTGSRNLQPRDRSRGRGCGQPAGWPTGPRGEPVRLGRTLKGRHGDRLQGPPANRPGAATRIAAPWPRAGPADRAGSPAARVSTALHAFVSTELHAVRCLRAFRSPPNGGLGQPPPAPPAAAALALTGPTRICRLGGADSDVLTRTCWRRPPTATSPSLALSLSVPAFPSPLLFSLLALALRTSRSPSSTPPPSGAGSPSPDRPLAVAGAPAGLRQRGLSPPGSPAPGRHRRAADAGPAGVRNDGPEDHPSS